ncbi:helix-turn-helix domain-containing protein [Flavimobilis rhizosphaerae]|nr:helix-turn-helix domain-containing protein [Flavimobilis rhizosphaerae]
MAAVMERRDIVVEPRAADEARIVADGLGDPRPGVGAVLSVEGRTVELPPALADLVGSVVRAVAVGRTVTVGTLPAELTTTVAAEQLGISRPTLMKLVADGKIPAHKVGSHTRVLTEDVVAFRRARLDRQRAALAELIELSDALGED